MNEAKWLSCSELWTLLDFMKRKAGHRKLRLFACACCRRIWRLLPEHCQRAVEVTERFADGLASREELRSANDAESIVFRATQPTASYDWFDAFRAAGNMARAEAGAAFPNAPHDHDDYLAAAARESTAAAAQADLLRDLFGNPFRPAHIDRSWHAWRDGVVRKMAQAIYDRRRFSDLPIVADALEEAGCTESTILAHCRSGKEHVRGCWVLDLLLDKP